MTELIKYDAACRALAEAVAVDDVADMRNKAEAMRHYARQAGDKGLEIQAAQIRFRAERRLGELLIAAKDAGQIGEGRPKNCSDQEQFSEPAPPMRVTLEQAGIDRKLSSKAQKMAAVDTAEFETALARHAEEMRSGQGRIAMDLLKIGAEEKGREHRRNLAAALSETSAELPKGRLFPAAYIDCPWKREGGVGNRAYENHYPTMTWPEILACLRQARDCLQPDAWVFFWIPRAHLLASVEIERELQVAGTGEIVTVKDRVPLSWACQMALDAVYSTCFVWTKTDIDHPDVSGSGLIARDQDELLLLFKRGQGLPKPAGSEKFGSNHRERPREHSRKPEFYRHMIATMVGRDKFGAPLPVLEMFARVDADNPLPENWQASGNQVAPIVEVAPIAPAIAEAEIEPIATPLPDWTRLADDLEAEQRRSRARIDELEAQCRLPLDDAEIDRQSALLLIKAGGIVPRDLAGDLIDLDLARDAGEGLVVTEQGEAWLRSLIDVPAAVLDLPTFLANREGTA